MWCALIAVSETSERLFYLKWYVGMDLRRKCLIDEKKWILRRIMGWLDR